MGRIRTVKPELFQHSRLYDAEIVSGLPLRIAFVGLFTCCDRKGRFKWRPRELKLSILPYDDCDFSRVLDALATHGFIVKYACSCDVLGAIPSWDQHQYINGKEPVSNLPEPTQDLLLDAYDTGEPRVIHASNTDGVKEGNGKEGNGATREARGGARATVRFTSDEVESIYDAYPRKVGKRAALIAIEKALNRIEGPGQVEYLLRVTFEFGRSPAGNAESFTPHPATWFNRSSYNDDPKEWEKAGR